MSCLVEEAGTYLLTDFLAASFQRSVIVELGLDRRPELRDDYFRHYTRVVWLTQRTHAVAAEGSRGRRCVHRPAARGDRCRYRWTRTALDPLTLTRRRSRSAAMAFATSSGASTAGECPTPGSETTVAPSRDAISRCSSSGHTSSRSPMITRDRGATAASSSVRSVAEHSSSIIAVSEAGALARKRRVRNVVDLRSWHPNPGSGVQAPLSLPDRLQSVPTHDLRRTSAAPAAGARGSRQVRTR